MDQEILLAKLEQLAADPLQLVQLSEEQRERLRKLAGRLAEPSTLERRALRKAFKKRDRALAREKNERALATTQLRQQRTAGKRLDAAIPMHAQARLESAPQPLATTPGQLETARYCYVCKAAYTHVHAFYDAMCASCGDFNVFKRTELADLTGKVALVTGGRVKIGQQIVLKLLACGARVIVSTRFPVDAARRFAELPEYEQFADRLQVYGLDLRHTPSVEAFATHLEGTLDRLDFIINNACQTVRRPPSYYRHLLAAENHVPDAPAQRLLPARVEKTLSSAALSQLAYDDEDAKHDLRLFPEHALDVDEQQIDLRKVNSWRLRLHEVPTPELLEVQLVNAVAPFVLNGRLRALMARTPGAKHIVNVSAMEGQFNRGTKTDKHPHTNMAKAALNMMTRTSASDYARDAIYMNSVDTGWVTDEDPAEIALRKEREGFQPPLDIVDGAARVCDPIIAGYNAGRHDFGLFLKDYRPTEW